MSFDDVEKIEAAVAPWQRELRARLHATLTVQANDNGDAKQKKEPGERTIEFTMFQLGGMRGLLETNRRAEDARIEYERKLAGLPEVDTSSPEFDPKSPKFDAKLVADFEAYVSRIRALTVEGKVAYETQMGELAHFRVLGDVLILQGASGFSEEIQKASLLIRQSYGPPLIQGQSESSWETFRSELGAAYFIENVPTNYTSRFELDVAARLQANAERVIDWTNMEDHAEAWQPRQPGDLAFWHSLQRQARSTANMLQDASIPAITGPITTLS